jgi:hypothetical protein
MAEIAALITVFNPVVTDTSAPPLIAAPIVGYPKNAESARSRGLDTVRGASSLPVSIPDPAGDPVDAGRRRPTVARVSATIRAAPREDPQDPFRRRCPTITAALVSVVTVLINALSPRTPE